MTELAEPAPTALSLARIGRATLVAAVISALANVALGAALRSGLAIDPVFAPLTPASIVVFTVTLTLVGGAAFAVIARRRPTDAVRRFTIVAVVVGIVSLGAPLSLLGASQAEWPGVSTVVALALMPLHMVAAVVLVVSIRRSFRVRVE
jgi:hypothetical protein